MRKVERIAAQPDDLAEKGLAELAKATTHYEADPPNKGSYAFAAYKLKSVKDALEGMFHGKCAYCETFYASVQPLDVEHFRPKGAVVEAEAHRGYWWLAAAWQNLLPSCIDCNRKRNQVTPRGDTSQVRLLENTAGFSNSATTASGKKDSFPIAASGVRAKLRTDALQNEKPLLLNPCEDEPGQHLTFFFDRDRPVSFVLAKQLEDNEDYSGDDGLSLKGATSIHVYGLNRLRLVQARTEVLRRLEIVAGLAVDLKRLANELQSDVDPKLKRVARQLDGFADTLIAELVRMAGEDQPYSAMTNAWLKDFKKQLR